MVRRSLRLLLDSESDLQVVAEASDLSSVMRQVNDQPAQGEEYVSTRVAAGLDALRRAALRRGLIGV